MTKVMPEKGFYIDYNGHWFHDGEAILREALAKLFADKALRLAEGGGYELYNPVEGAFPIIVKDVPFMIVVCRVMNDDALPQKIILTDNFGHEIVLDQDHTTSFRLTDAEGNRIPYVEIRDGLHARFSRKVYDELAGLGFDQRIARGQALYEQGKPLFLDSCGVEHVVGLMD